jgi:hypothetical protein
MVECAVTKGQYRRQRGETNDAIETSRFRIESQMVDALFADCGGITAKTKYVVTNTGIWVALRSGVHRLENRVSENFVDNHTVGLPFWLSEGTFGTCFGLNVEDSSSNRCQKPGAIENAV